MSEYQLLERLPASRNSRRRSGRRERRGRGRTRSDRIPQGETRFGSIHAATALHGKNIRISTDILWRVFHILTEPVPYYVCIRQSMWARTSLFVDLRIQLYTIRFR